MKHILYKILLVTLLFSNISAEISQNQVDEYMKVSRSGAALQYVKDDMFYQIVRMYKVDLNNTSKEVVKRIKNELNTKIYVRKYTEEFKLFDASQYDKMMSFYHTATGKKYAKVMEKDFKLDQNSSRTTLREKFKTFLVNHPFSEEKKILINKIIESLNTVDISIQAREELEIYKQHILPIKYEINHNNIKSIESIKKQVKINYSSMKAYQEETDMIYFKDFSEEELKEVLKYTSTPVARLEYKLMKEAGISYYKVVINDIMEDLFDEN